MPKPIKFKKQSFWAGALRDTTPRSGDALSNGSTVLLAKPLPKQEGLCHGSIVLCQTYTEFVTWYYNEDTAGCDHGHYYPFTDDGLQAAFED